MRVSELLLVFWYDEDAEYTEEIDSITLSEGHKLWKVTENNWFETKLQVEIRDKDTSYLLYAPFDNIDLGIMCVLAGVRVLSLEELTKSVLLGGFEDNSIVRKMEHYKIGGAFWRMVEDTYGYKDDPPDLRNFFATIVMTYTDVLANGHIPNVWKTFLSEKSNDCVVLVKNLMNNVETAAFYDEQAEMISSELKVRQLLMDIPLENVVYMDSFTEFDENLISLL